MDVIVLILLEQNQIINRVAGVQTTSQSVRVYPFANVGHGLAEHPVMSVDRPSSVPTRQSTTGSLQRASDRECWSGDNSNGKHNAFFSHRASRSC